jgi:hypothetical protein
MPEVLILTAFIEAAGMIIPDQILSIGGFDIVSF